MGLSRGRLPIRLTCGVAEPSSAVGQAQGTPRGTSQHFQQISCGEHPLSCESDHESKNNDESLPKDACFHSTDTMAYALL